MGSIIAVMIADLKYSVELRSNNISENKEFENLLFYFLNYGRPTFEILPILPKK